MKALVFDQQIDLSIDENTVAPIVRFVLEQESQSTNEVAIYFVSKEEISIVHDEFFNDPSPTDCISFPMDKREESSYHILGEIFICPKVAIEYLAEDLAVTHDVYAEVTLYLVHALLHLLGYKDEEESDQIKMYSAQESYLDLLIKKKLLLRPVTSS